MTDKALVQYEKYQDLFRSEKVLTLFKDNLGDRALPFITAAMAVINDDDKLASCTPMSLMTTCLKAAAHDLTVHPAAAQFYIIPYGNKATGQIGYKGWAHMALRTGQYAVLNTNFLSGTERVVEDKLTGQVKGIEGEPDGVPRSVFSYYKLKDGREAVVVWTLEEIHAHADKYSKAKASKKNKSFWNDPDQVRDMEKKTVLLQLLKKHNAPIDFFGRGEITTAEDYDETNGDKLEEVLEAQVRDIGMDPELETEPPITADEVTGEIELTVEDEYWTLARALDKDPAEAEKKAKEILALSSDDFEIALGTVKSRVK